MVDEATIDKAVDILQKAAPGAKVMLFGSYAAGKADDKSDVDLVVVEPQLGSRRHEADRLRAALQPLGIPVDLMVISQATFDSWTRVPNAITQFAQKPNASYSSISFGSRFWSLVSGQSSSVGSS
jgi:predicted nucleotidyltransferase